MSNQLVAEQRGLAHWFNRQTRLSDKEIQNKIKSRPVINRSAETQRLMLKYVHPLEREAES
jgi:hypothetical protein